MTNKSRIALIFAFICTAELVARGAESAATGDSLFNHFFFDEQLSRQGLIEDGGVFQPDYQMHINSRGFRDSKAWPPVLKSAHRKIVIGAAGHGFGENLSEEHTYASQLELTLNGLSAEPVAIHNLSVQGSTILFFERALLEEVIQSQPDVVILSYSGFNEALLTTVPESRILLPNNRLHNILMSSALLRKSRQWLGALSGRKHRVSPLEMVNSYARIVSALEANEIEVLLLQQFVIHPDIDGLWRLSDMKVYRKKLEDFAQQRNLDLADPLPFCPVSEDCFENGEWYSAKGHAAVLESLKPHFGLLLGSQANAVDSLEH